MVSHIENGGGNCYYLFATPQALPETESASAYVNEGYIDRWDRLKHAKSQTKEWYYSETARNYYAEYSAHMYAWFAIGWAEGRNMGKISVYAKQAMSTGIDWITQRVAKGGELE